MALKDLVVTVNLMSSQMTAEIIAKLLNVFPYSIVLVGENGTIATRGRTLLSVLSVRNGAGGCVDCKWGSINLNPLRAPCRDRALLTPTTTG